MTKSDFYRDKSVSETEWWLNDQCLPDFVWARLRVFNDGTADACLAEGVTLYGFDNRENAANLLATDDLTRFADWDEEEEEAFEISLAEIQPPNWVDPPDQDFVYAGTHPAPPWGSSTKPSEKM